MFWLDRDYFMFKQKSIITFLVIPVTILLCMSFPLPFSSEFIMDLRYIPFLLGALYIGFPSAIVAMLTIIPYRYIIGGDGIYLTLVISTLLFIIPFLKGYFFKLNSRKKILFISSIAFSESLLTLISIRILDDVPTSHMILPGAAYILITVLGACLVTFLIEDMFHYKALREKIYLETDKLSTISQLSASVSHEVRNPLTVTKGFLQLLYNDNVPEEKRKSYIDLALSELYRGEAIITDFLSLTKSNQETVPLDVVKELNYVTNIIYPYALMNKVDVQTSIEKEHVFVDGVASYFRQCFINIAKNGIEAIPNGGALQLTVKGNNTHVFIIIKDSGIGMTPKEVEKLGTRYFTTKDKGTGLGTPLIFRIVQSMNGSIDIKSQPGDGTEFKVTFPVSSFHSESA
ncbi:sensor histidine kinase [Evansella vedderi]|nr:HAMP domain-containing sensor histidine kinase [Evansella vedderi]